MVGHGLSDHLSQILSTEDHLLTMAQVACPLLTLNTWNTQQCPDVMPNNCLMLSFFLKWGDVGRSGLQPVCFWFCTQTSSLEMLGASHDLGEHTHASHMQVKSLKCCTVLCSYSSMFSYVVSFKADIWPYKLCEIL